jgi:hypothetical protein
VLRLRGEEVKGKYYAKGQAGGDLLCRGAGLSVFDTIYGTCGETGDFAGLSLVPTPAPVSDMPAMPSVAAMPAEPEIEK